MNVARDNTWDKSDKMNLSDAVVLTCHLQSVNNYQRFFSEYKQDFSLMVTLYVVVILATEDVFTATVKVILATKKVILPTEEVITATLKVISE